MTREQLKKHWDVISAFKDGAEVEFNSQGKWKYLASPDFSETLEYRIKPKTEYVPFDRSDAEFLLGKVVKHKKTTWICIITACGQANCYSGEIEYSYKLLFHEFTFLDGSPCGKLKQ